jgi:hypothetical protein
MAPPARITFSGHYRGAAVRSASLARGLPAGLLPGIESVEVAVLFDPATLSVEARTPGSEVDPSEWAGLEGRRIRLTVEVVED